MRTALPRRRSVLSASVSAAVLLIIVVQATLAACFGPNEGAWAGNFDVPAAFVRQGIKGEMDHFAATPLAGAGIVHPTQIAASNGDFVGWGTAKGVGVPFTECGDNFTASWEIYVDGTVNDVYFCKQDYGSVSNTAQNQFFRIEYTTCPGDGQPKFVFYWNSAWKTCKTIGADRGRVGAGSESTGTFSTQNLDVRYQAIRQRNTSGTWAYLTSLYECELDAPYTIAPVGTSQWTVN